VPLAPPLRAIQCAAKTEEWTVERLRERCGKVRSLTELLDRQDGYVQPARSLYKQGVHSKRRRVLPTDNDMLSDSGYALALLKIITRKIASGRKFGKAKAFTLSHRHVSCIWSLGANRSSRVRFTLTGPCLLLFLCLPVQGQTSLGESSAHPQKGNEDKEPIAILEFGAATSWNISGGAATFAPNLAGEITPIENWLELEAGVSPFYTRHSTEWDTDLLFKKPWTISRKTEFMLGIGPEWIYRKQNGKAANSIAGEIAGDFMFWPNGKHRFGWFLEPAYDYSFAGGRQQSIGMSGGLLVSIP
jgi:hypothetical protein